MGRLTPEPPSCRSRCGTCRRARAWNACGGSPRQLRDIGPDVIWVQEEPIDPFLLEMLALYRFRSRPRIVTAVCENIFPRPPVPPSARPAASSGRGSTTS